MPQLSRILFIKCQSRVGSRKATSKPLDERITANYRNLCHGMLAATGNGNLTYDGGGFEAYASFFGEIEPQLTPDAGELSFMAEWAGKLHGNMTRLAGLIHCITAFEQGRNPLLTPINAEEAKSAATLARYYLAHAKAVYTEQAEPESISNARYLWAKIKAMKTDKKNELTHMTHGKQGFNLDESLEELVKRGYIRIEPIQTGGRPSPVIVINPNVKNMVTKVMKAPENEPFVPFVTIPADVPNVKTAADFSGFLELSDYELKDVPFLQEANHVEDIQS